MTKGGLQKLPFDLVLNKSQTLTKQVADGIAKAIRLGKYRVGDVLPSTRNLAVQLGVSRIVTRGAVRMLTEQGYVSPRPGIGCVVAEQGTKFWKGHVVFVVKNFAGSYYTNVIADVLSRTLSDEGYLFSQVVVAAGDGWRYDEPGEYDFSGLEMALSQSVDLAVIMADSQHIASFISKRGVPFVVIGEEQYSYRSFVGLIRFDRGCAVEEFAEHCREMNVGSVLQVGVESEAADAVPALQKFGVRAKRLIVPVDHRYYWLEGVQRSAMKCILDELSDPSKRPDLLFFNDDFVAVGGLQAIEALGISVPKDMKIVAWANHGIGPVYHKPLTRMMMDPYQHGAMITKYISSALSGEKLPRNARVGPLYQRGMTT
ncbi:MAG: GntR family transcriptional regulator [Kiritimatiellae bacterium]|nr:GntR family transcriptional regulator [Kiritimatiellia bacterium]